jgi:hypothetical protein
LIQNLGPLGLETVVEMLEGRISDLVLEHLQSFVDLLVEEGLEVDGADGLVRLDPLQKHDLGLADEDADEEQGQLLLVGQPHYFVRF